MQEEISNAMISMLASEKVLAKNWLSKEDEEAERFVKGELIIL